MTTLNIDVEDFLNGALMSWMESCLPRPEILSGYASLIDGTIVHNVWLQIDPEPQYHIVPLNELDGIALSNGRAKNFSHITLNIKALYEDELGQTLLVLPDCSILGHSPDTKQGLEQMKLLLTLLLGAAVQCPNKQLFIGRIKELDLSTQHEIVEVIKQVTNSQSLVLTTESPDLLSMEQMLAHITKLAKERDTFYTKWMSCAFIDSDRQASAQRTTTGDNQSSSSGSSTSNPTINSSSNDPNHMAVELANLKSKLRKLRQELEEKSEGLMEAKEELEHKKNQYEKLRLEGQAWYSEAKRVTAYRDEVDVLRERVERADRLEVEAQRLREKLSDAEFYKTRVEELREDNRMLLETKEMLEDQLQRSRKRSEHAMQLETEMIKYKQRLNDMALERDVDKSRLQELLEENTQLQITAKNLTITKTSEQGCLSDGDEENASGDNSLSEQLTTNAQTRAIKLELENRRLLAALEAMKETSFQEHATKVLELEKENKKINLKFVQVQDNCKRLTQQNNELEQVFKNALEENRKMQTLLDVKQQANDKQNHDRDIDRTKIIDLETSIETLTKEKQRVQTLSENIQRRADDLDRTLGGKTKECDDLQAKMNELSRVKQELYESKSKGAILEKDNNNFIKETTKLKKNIEEKDVEMDSYLSTIQTFKTQMQQLEKNLQETNEELSKIQKLESENQELITQQKIDAATIINLQEDLVQGTLKTKKVQQGLEKLGLDETEIDSVEYTVETLVEKLAKNPENFKTIKEIILSVEGNEIASSDMCVMCHRKEVFTVEKNIEISGTYDNESDIVDKTEELVSSVTAQWREQCDLLIAENSMLRSENESLQSENARQEVDVATSKSKLSSLNTQHIALQLAISQLAVEKDLLLKQLELLKQQRESTIHDQVTLQCLHEQLSVEYESLNKEKELLKSSLRDVRIENRDLKEHEAVMKKQIEDVENELENVNKESVSLGNLRAEHSKLKDDFRNLFTTSERLKNEYKNIQERYRGIRAENATLKIQNTEITGELNNRSDQANRIELEYTKMTQRCEMLLQTNGNLDTDRRTLMDHVSQLLSQYHELLTHSLEDKQHFHDEEKLFTDKVNNLHRQKEKLEEKIMEHYGKLESCSPKKKGFGHSLVKKVRKAGSDLINRVPSRNRRSWVDDSRLTQSQLTFGSESGGNESDNSIEEPSFSGTELPLQRRSHLRTSLQRHPTDDESTSTLTRGGVRSSLQSFRKESTKVNRNSFQGLSTPEIVNNGFNLGAAGSRRTVYLVDENEKTAEAAAAAATSTPTPSPSPSNQTVKSENNAPTLLMYNRISNIITNVDDTSLPNVPDQPSVDNSCSTALPSADDKKKTEDREKESAIWYEYGCV